MKNRVPMSVWMMAALAVVMVICTVFMAVDAMAL